MRYYAQLKTGKLMTISWVAYELLLAEHNWKHRLNEQGLAIIFKPRKRSKWK
jgi:hypothetical protein